MTRRRTLLAGLILALAVGAWSWQPAARVAATLPASLTDAEFWSLVETLSEPGGTFHSDNFVSNEGRYQLVIPELISRVQPGGLYLGVGPEQNFTYMVAVRPKMAFILDIRRGNLQEHLLYKALFELSADRAEFVSRLFSRARPAGLTTASTPEAIFSAYDKVPSSEDLYRANLKTVLTQLTARHRFALRDEDKTGIDYIYRNAFFSEGPSLGYALTGRGRLGNTPSYADLMSMTDGTGRQRSYLATEDHFRFLKDLETRNLVVPVVGNFGGPKALRAIGKYVRDRGATVSVFYVSNVEQYLRQDGLWGTFCENVKSMPLDAASTFIRSTRGGGRGFTAPAGAGPGMFTSDLAHMQADTRSCAALPAARPVSR
jgi:hypothetical protein